MADARSGLVRPVILCGGAGTRLWPVSTQHLPKQFLALFGERSLLQQTAERLTGEGFAAPVVVSGAQQHAVVEEQLQNHSVSVEAILLEPVGRNTAAAAVLAAAWSQSTGSDELLLLMPSDHVIGDREAFIRAIEAAVPHATSGDIVSFGAKPTGPNSQYGYIEARFDEPLGDGAYPIAKFHEKPSTERAAAYVATGRFFWNCGIFLAKAGTILEQAQAFIPASVHSIVDAVQRATRDGNVVRPSADSFSRAENISFDHAIMEKTSRGVVIPVDMNWSDVGAWDAVWNIGDKDPDGNVSSGRIAAVDCRNSLLRNDSGALIAAIGLEDIAVIAVDGAFLVAPLDRVAELKSLLTRLESEGPD